MFLRAKILAILLCCTIGLLLISSHYNNGKLRTNACLKCQKRAKENFNIFSEISEPLYQENLYHDYSYEDYGKEMMYDKVRSLITENELQNYRVLNKIEYVDFMNSSEKSIVKPANPNVISLKQLLSVCVKAAKAGGIQLQSVRRNFDLKKIWKVKPSNISDNPISVGRTLSHDAMAYTLKKHFPDIQLVSRKFNGYHTGPYERDFLIQNTTDDDLVPTKNILVWFDPLDPENEYQQNFLEYVTTTVCVAVKGKPVIGVIHQPFENFTKWGWVGHGLSDDAYPVASEPVDVSKPLSIIVPAIFASEVKIKATMAFRIYFDMFAVNGAGFSFIQVTEGRADGYMHVLDAKKWKICAGDAIIRAANGKMTSLKGKEIDYGDPTRYTQKSFKATIEDLYLFKHLSSFELNDRH